MKKSLLIAAAFITFSTGVQAYEIHPQAPLDEKGNPVNGVYDITCARKAKKIITSKISGANVAYIATDSVGRKYTFINKLDAAAAAICGE